MSITRLPEIVFPLAQVNKVNEIVDVLNDNLNMYYSATNPALTPVEGVATWVVTHNLGTENVNCSLYNGDNLVISNVSVTSDNVITVSFNATTSIAQDTYKIVVISNGAGSASGSGSYVLPTASITTLGGVRIDGSSITISNGVISSTVDSTLSSTSENPVQNKVIDTALIGKLDIDASNLSSTGQKVFDGQWVKRGGSLKTGETLPTSVATRVEISLSSFLPNDDCSYEVSLNGIVYAGSTNAANTLSVYGKDTEISHYMCRVYRTGESNVGNAIVDVGSSRIVVVDYWAANSGTFDLKMQGYRRIGTNS